MADSVVAEVADSAEAGSAEDSVEVADSAEAGSAEDSVEVAVEVEAKGVERDAWERSTLFRIKAPRRRRSRRNIRPSFPSSGLYRLFDETENNRFDRNRRTRRARDTRLTQIQGSFRKCTVDSRHSTSPSCRKCTFEGLGNSNRLSTSRCIPNCIPGIRRYAARTSIRRNTLRSRPYSPSRRHIPRNT